MAAIIIDTYGHNRDQYKEPSEGDYVSVGGRIYSINAVSTYEDTWIVQGDLVRGETDGSYEHTGEIHSE